MDRSKTTYLLPVQKLTTESFNRFGQIISGDLSKPSFCRPGLDNWRVPFESDAPPRLQVMRYYQQNMRFSRIERHTDVTETRFPIANARAVLIVADSVTSPDNPDPPSPFGLQAFYIDGTAGIMFNKGVWHGLDCYPVGQPYADFLFLSDTKTEDEIESLGSPVSGVRTQVIDYAKTENLNFEVVDPDKLLKPPMARNPATK